MLRLNHGARCLAISLLALFSLMSGYSQKSETRDIQRTDKSTTSRTLLWGDEFNGPNGSMPDLKKWIIAIDKGVAGIEVVELASQT